MTPIIMPQVGNDISTATIVEWRKKVGDRVEEGDVVLVIETDKSAFEVEAEASGTLVSILHSEGDEVEVLKPIGYIGEEGELPTGPGEEREEHPTAAAPGAKGREPPVAGGSETVVGAPVIPPEDG